MHLFLLSLCSLLSLPIFIPPLLNLYFPNPFPQCAVACQGDEPRITSLSFPYPMFLPSFLMEHIPLVPLHLEPGCYKSWILELSHSFLHTAMQCNLAIRLPYPILLSQCS